MLEGQHTLCNRSRKPLCLAEHCKWYWKIFKIFSLIFIGKNEKCLMERGWSLELTDLSLDAKSTTLSSVILSKSFCTWSLCGFFFKSTKMWIMMSVLE